VITIRDALDYEIRSSWWACWISNDILQTVSGKYFAWKVNRKYMRYVNRLAAEKLLKTL
jgi:hypothetical protein